MDNKNNEKTFKEKMAVLKRTISRQHPDTRYLDSFPEDFYQLDEEQLMFLWHFISDKEIAKLYDVSEYAVNKQRRSFGVNPISSTLDRMKRNM